MKLTTYYTFEIEGIRSPDTWETAYEAERAVSDSLAAGHDPQVKIIKVIEQELDPIFGLV